MLTDQSAALAAHRRARAALPATVHRIAHDDPPPAAPDVRQRGQWARRTRPEWLPAIGERCVLVGGQYAGICGVAGTMRGSRRAAMVSVHSDDGRTVLIRPEFVAAEGTPVPAVPTRHRKAANSLGLVAGDRLRILRGPREGMVVVFVRRAGQCKPGRPTLRILIEPGRYGTVLADCVERLA